MNKIRQIRELRGISQAELARRAHTSQPQIDRLEKGERRLTDIWMHRIAPALGPDVKPSDLIGSLPSAVILPSDSETNVRGADVPATSFRDLPKDVPVYGCAECGEGAFEMDQGRIVDYVRRPPGIANARDVFALYLCGSSMEPALLAGDLIYLDPNKAPVVGRYVVLELKPKREGDHSVAMCKVLLRKTAAYYEVRQFNPEKTFRVGVDTVYRAFRVLTNTELMGV